MRRFGRRKFDRRSLRVELDRRCVSRREGLLQDRQMRGILCRVLEGTRRAAEKRKRDQLEIEGSGEENKLTSESDKNL